MKFENAKITSTEISNERGLVFWLHLSGDGWGCAFGGVRLTPAKVSEILTVFECSWEQLPGKFCRAEFSGCGSQLIKIGHIVENRWVSI